MKETALFVGWGGAFPGRELVALDGYHEWVKILEELKEKGEIEDFITVALSPTGSELDGFTLVFADEMTLMQLSQREDFHRLQLLGEREFAKFMVIPAVTGERVEHEFKLLQEEILPRFEHVHV